MSTTDPTTAHWFPHLERPLGIVPTPASPAILYQEGPAGDSLKDILSNRVIWVQ